MTRWMVVRGGEISGPHSRDEVLALARRSKIHGDTPCWQPQFGEDWLPFRRTEPGRAHAAAPRPDGTWAWTLAATPIVFALGVALGVSAGAVASSDPAGPQALLVTGFALCFVLMRLFAAALDRRNMVRSQCRLTPSFLWGLFVPPVYLWKRETAIGGRRPIFWAHLVCLLVACVALAAFQGTPTALAFV